MTEKRLFDSSIEYLYTSERASLTLGATLAAGGHPRLARQVMPSL